MALSSVLGVLALLAFVIYASAAGCGKCTERFTICCTPQTNSDGWGWERVPRNVSCIFPGSTPASQKCGNSFRDVEGGQRCGDWPVCQLTSDDGDGWGYEPVVWDTCIVKNSKAASDLHCASSSHNPNPPSGGKCNVKYARNSCPCGWECGCQVVNGLGRRKQQILGLNAGIQFLASAMMETDHMSVKEYPPGDGKVEGSYCAGLAKQNWFMVRMCGNKSWKKLGEKSYRKMTKLNKSLSFDIKMYKNCRARLSESKFFSGHRWGYEGYCKTKDHSYDINCFIKSYHWTLKHLKGANLKNDYRYYVKIDPK